MMTLDQISHVGIAILGLSAIILVARKNKWGFIIGLISEPFWLYTSFINKQFGVFLLSVVYVFTWSYGIYVWFFKDKKDDK